MVKLRAELNGEVDALKSEFQELKAALRQQLELTTAMAKVRGAKRSKQAPWVHTAPQAGGAPEHRH